MAGKELISIDEFIVRLRRFEGAIIARDSVLDFCASVQVADSSLQPYTFFDSQFYTRNLIYRNEYFEVIAICWEPGQRTAVHTHNGQLCWMITQRGNLAVVDYKWVGCDHPENQNVVGIDCLAGSDHTRIEVVREIEACTGGPVLTADKLQTIHRLYNLSETSERAVSLHIYSRPIDSCVAFDMEKNHCYRRHLDYFSQFGQTRPRDQAPSSPSSLVQISH
ncbi:MAG TPA: cysteine dioxygenase family protein [Blastocatellia bacterium]|nr:cysteine dioxygenase family protein [Blastocatellia bacterium]